MEGSGLVPFCPELGGSRTVFTLDSTCQKNRSLTIVFGIFSLNFEPPKFVLHVTMSMFVTFLIFRWLWLCGETGPGGEAVAETGAVFA